MGKNKKPFSELRKQHQIELMARFSGTLKNQILNDIEKGISGSELIREMAQQYYDTKANKHNY